MQRARSLALPSAWRTGQQLRQNSQPCAESVGPCITVRGTQCPIPRPQRSCISWEAAVSREARGTAFWPLSPPGDPCPESPVPITGPARRCCLAQEWGQAWPASPPQESRPHPVGGRLCPVTDTASPTGPPECTWGQFCFGPCALSPLSPEAFLDTLPPLSFPPQACAPGPSSRPSPHWASLICLSIRSYLSLAIGCLELRSLLIGVVSLALRCMASPRRFFFLHGPCPPG